ncbi:MAG: carboxypeptidase regulatory-like domain-containing protein [Candidatus Pseudobacter hemicellulosilyticus]|uniref:Carboxypeptidase regulatory-like domain-containing protein n=1 Tax=Candidatus Pseudobacter hemicellulosilyticus TaxID=3121375 RepID=A0AAJ5WRX6_9BACT|nr:MAG: carboxypeptidase regulatory-like domain-containing protein [Pseudobacter sp.]
MKQILYRLLSVVVAVFFLLPAQAQETNGSLTGKITNEKEEPLEGATVSAVHLPSGTSYGLSTDKGGKYYLPGLRIGGPYSITVSMIGMQPQVKENITIRLGEPLLLNFVLAPTGEELSEVVVRAGRLSPRANTYGAGLNISRAQLSNMPTISRSIQDMTRMVPQGSKDNSFGGTSFRYNNMTVDGAINNDAIGFSPSMGGITGSSGMPGSSTRANAISLDAIEDMQVYLAPFDVKIGNFTGASINAVTRSGTNKVTGSIYGFGRNASTISKDKAGSLGKMNSDFHDYQAGFRIGFPIIKNKLFFFTNEEITRRRDPSQLLAGNKETAHILSVADADNIRNSTTQRYGDAFDPGTAGIFNAEAESIKFFNRIDWNISSRHQLAIRNNTILSKAVHMDRDQQDFRFSSMAFEQKNNQTSTVLELKSRFNNRLSNSLVLGYSVVNDSRTPTANPAMPQIQIMGRTPGTTIYLGTDREASIFNMKQRTIEITNNLTYRLGDHTLLLGTHNELYRIGYGFVNGWNGRVDYLSVEDYLNNIPYRVRGNYNFNNNDRNHILNNPEAAFNVNMFGLYVQDEIQVSDKWKLSPGIRADYMHLPTKPQLSNGLRNAQVDPYFGNTYAYTLLSRIDNSYLNKIQLSPRLGFRYDIKGNQSWILRGGTGIFIGRIPFAWMAYAYYNNGVNYGSFDQRADNKVFVPGTDPLKPGPNGIADFIRSNGTDISNRNAAKTQIDVMDNNFQMPRIWRTNVAVDHTTSSGYKLTLEGMMTKTIKDVLFQQLNTRDNPTYYAYDVNREQPVYSGTVDPAFANTYLLSNTNRGYRYSITGSVSRNYDFGLNLMLAYTYGGSKDVSNGIRNSMESAWQLNQALVPNNPGLAWSNFDIRHRIVLNTTYNKRWNDTWRTSVTLFAGIQSGSPFTYGIVNNSIQGLSQQVSLVYIPERDQAVNYFRDYTEAGQTITAAAQAQAFNSYIDNNKYLSGRRGSFTERNGGRTPWNVQTDLHLAQEFHFSKDPGAHFITITLDVLNVANLLNSNWGKVYFSPNTFNSTASTGLTPEFPAQQNPANYPVYRFADPGTPYSIDFFSSRTQLQLGVRYSF